MFLQELQPQPEQKQQSKQVPQKPVQVPQQPDQVPQQPDLDQLQVSQEDHHLKSSKPNLEQQHQDKLKSRDTAQQQQQRSGQREQQRHVSGIQIQVEDDSRNNFSPRVTRFTRYN